MRNNSNKKGVQTLGALVAASTAHANPDFYTEISHAEESKTQQIKRILFDKPFSVLVPDKQSSLKSESVHSHTDGSQMVPQSGQSSPEQRVQATKEVHFLPNNDQLSPQEIHYTPDESSSPSKAVSSQLLRPEVNILPTPAEPTSSQENPMPPYENHIERRQTDIQTPPQQTLEGEQQQFANGKAPADVPLQHQEMQLPTGRNPSTPPNNIESPPSDCQKPSPVSESHPSTEEAKHPENADQQRNCDAQQAEDRPRTLNDEVDSRMAALDGLHLGGHEADCVEKAKTEFEADGTNFNIVQTAIDQEPEANSVENAHFQAISETPPGEAPSGSPKTDINAIQQSKAIQQSNETFETDQHFEERSPNLAASGKASTLVSTKGDTKGEYVEALHIQPSATESNGIIGPDMRRGNLSTTGNAEETNLRCATRREPEFEAAESRTVARKDSNHSHANTDSTVGRNELKINIERLRSDLDHDPYIDLIVPLSTINALARFKVNEKVLGSVSNPVLLQQVEKFKAWNPSSLDLCEEELRNVDERRETAVKHLKELKNRVNEVLKSNSKGWNENLSGPFLDAVNTFLEYSPEFTPENNIIYELLYYVFLPNLMADPRPYTERVQKRIKNWEKRLERRKISRIPFLRKNLLEFATREDQAFFRSTRDDTGKCLSTS